MGVKLAILVHISQLDGFSDADRAAVRIFLVADHFKQGGFPGPVRTDNAHDAPGRQTKAHVLDKQAVTQGFADAIRFDDHIAQARAWRNIQLQIPLTFLGFLGE